MPKDDQLVEVEVERLKPHPRNPRKGDVNTIMQSLERFGQVSPLVVQRSTGFVVKGNHTLQALIRLGRPTAKILVKDLSDEEATAYLLADNRTSDKGKYNDDALFDLLGEVTNLEGTGFDLDDLETLADGLGGNVADVDDIGEVIKVKADPGKPKHPVTEGEEREATRDIVLMMPLSLAQMFGTKIAVLQKAYGTRTLVETVVRAVTEAADGA